jgi:hypothetical protein
LPGFADLDAVTVSVACQANEFAKICGCLAVVAYRFSRLSVSFFDGSVSGVSEVVVAFGGIDGFD